MRTGRAARAAWLAVFSWLCGCVDRGAEPDTGTGLTPVEDWTTEAEFEFGDRFEGDALFGSVGDVDVRDGPEGPRVHVLDLQFSEVTIWKPDGTLLRRVGGEGEGPGEFTGPHDLVLLEDRFYVADERRFTSFTLEGEVMGTDAVPASLGWRGFRFRNEAMFDDGSFVVTPVVPSGIIVGSSGDDPVDVIPGLRISRKGASWTLDTLALISYRNWLVPFKLAGDPTPVRLSQEWVVPDSFRPDAPGGSVVLGRTQELPPGALELMEISMTGDTVWTRQIRLPPVPIEDYEVDSVVNQAASVFASWSGDSVPSPILRQRVRSALIVPEAWPVTYGIRPMPNGEIWFRPARSPTPGTWYAVRRGETDGPIRRISLPESFNPRDVTDTHVWGTRTDELGVQYVVGRRWVPPDHPSVAYSSRTAVSPYAARTDSASGYRFISFTGQVSCPNLAHRTPARRPFRWLTLPSMSPGQMRSRKIHRQHVGPAEWSSARKTRKTPTIAAVPRPWREDGRVALCRSRIVRHRNPVSSRTVLAG